jgi:hypothetical protein
VRSPSIALVLALALVACGDNIVIPIDAELPDRLEIVGHNGLGDRGMSSALAVAGDTVYVGSRIDNQPILIVDVANPAAPTVVGELGMPAQALAGMSARELRAVDDLDLLVVLNLQCSPDLHGCGPNAAEQENLKLYDISDRRAPVLRATYPITGTSPIRPRGPHEMFLWRDPAQPARVLIFVAAPGAPDQYEIVDVTDPAAPVRVTTWDAVVDGGISGFGNENILHSVSATTDGRTAWFSHQQGGLFAVDQGDVIDGVVPPVLALLTPIPEVLLWPPQGTVGPHSAVPVPGRPLLVVTEEIYPPPFSTGCPWGHMRVVSADPANPSILGEYKVPENASSYCSSGMPTDRIAFTAHNATATASLAFVTWYSAGLQVIDLADPAAPANLVDFRPPPLASVTTEDPALGGNPTSMWSYPVIKDGLIYVTDSRNGLYVLRYHGRHDTEVATETFLEGNSNL